MEEPTVLTPRCGLDALRPGPSQPQRSNRHGSTRLVSRPCRDRQRQDPYQTRRKDTPVQSYQCLFEHLQIMTADETWV